MQTRVIQLGHLCLSLVFCLGLASCNQDEFYEKEFIESNEPTTAGSVDGSSQGGFNTGSSAGGATTGSSTVGSTDGSSSAGSTTGSSTTGSSTAGSTDGSATAGSSTGSSTTGSTNGSVTAGSTTGSSTTGSTTSGSTGIPQEEIFHQAASETKKLDILWVIDSSGSMSEEQTALGVNFSSFIQNFIAKDVDFKMGITTTDTTTGKDGLMVAGSDVKLTSAMAAQDSAQFMDDFKNLIKVGISGSGYEKGLQASEAFMTRYSSSFIRPEAYLAVVIVSDEEDQSPKTPAEYAAILKSYKSQAGLVKMYSIVDKTLSNTGASGISTGYQRYADATAATAGVVSDIREDFHQVLTEMGDSIINLLDSFALANNAILGSVRVYVDGLEVSNFTYDDASRSVKFDNGYLPPVGSEVKVKYLK
ncbi:MAG TPA: hypothetical protein VNJ01_04705 [Bacteriovoracaceae bacterium]|nr:hypothetical protein [Bacteriovoracaceae bacterium]